MKKFFKISFFVLMFYTAINIPAVFASPVYSGVSNGQTITTNTEIILISCDDNNPSEGYYYNIATYKDGELLGDIPCTDLPDTIVNLSSADNGNYSFVEYDPSYCIDIGTEYCASNNTADSLYNLPNGQYKLDFVVNITNIISTTKAGIFLPVNDETGENVGANALMASVGNATSKTVGNVAPVAVVVMSLILGFMFIVTIIGLVKKTDGTQETKKRI